MIKYTLPLISFIFFNTICSAQIRTNNNNFWVAKEFNKDIALFNTKNFLYSRVLGSNEEVVRFEVVPLASASSGELTTLLYKCESKKKEGLVLGFYGSNWNAAGVIYTGYDFKNFDKLQAIEFLNKIQSALDDNYKYLRDDNDNNNIYFKYDDVEVLIWTSSSGYTIRLFWNGFDSTWEKTAFERSKRRFERKIK